MSRRFYLYRRNQVYYVQLRNPLTGNYLTAKSTGKRDRDEAAALAMEWLKSGIPSARTRWTKKPIDIYQNDKLFQAVSASKLDESEIPLLIDLLKDKGYLTDAILSSDTANKKTFISYLRNFWDFDNSEYVAEQLKTGQTIGRRRCKDALSMVKRYYVPYWKKIQLSGVTKLNLKQFCLWLSDQRSEKTGETLSPNSVNRITSFCGPALKWAFKNDLISTDPTPGLLRMSGNARKRGILTPPEIGKLFTVGNWNGDEGSRLACLLSSQTGLRASELAGLQVRDIGEDRLFIRHSWDRLNKTFKKPKNGETRETPLLPETRKLLLDYAKTNKWEYGPSSFVFFSKVRSDVPVSIESFLKRLRIALESIGITRDEQKARNLTVHSFRHYWATEITRTLGEKAAKFGGWKTEDMLLHYSSHRTEKDFKEGYTAAAQAFGQILSFDNKEVSNG